MSNIFEPEVIASYLTSLFTDATLVGLLPGGVHETDATESASPGTTATRRATPYLVFGQLAGAGDIQGAGGTVLVSDTDYKVQVLYRPSEVEGARAALRRAQALLEGTEPAEVPASGGIDAYALVIRAAGALPRLPHREPMGALVYAEGKRWRIRVQRI